MRRQTMHKDHDVTAEGVWFASKDRAKRYADVHDKDVVESNAGWLAKNRTTEFGPMPTKDGDVVLFHVHQKYQVWVATWDGAQGPDPNVKALSFWNADHARHAAQMWATGQSRLFQREKDGRWSVMAK